MDYKKSCIYAIRSHKTDKIYIGSTCTPLYKRFYEHKKKYKAWLNDNTKYYTTSYEILKFDDAYIELYEEYPCENKKQLHRKEGEVIRAVDCVNKMVAGRTYKEYYNENKQKSKEYREKNKERIKQQRKKHYEENKERLRQKSKEYQQKNKEQIKQKRLEKKNKKELDKKVINAYLDFVERSLTECFKDNPEGARRLIEELEKKEIEKKI